MELKRHKSKVMELKRNKSKVISNQSLMLLKSKIQTSINTNQKSEKSIFVRNDGKDNKTKTIRFNTLAAQIDDAKLFSQQLFNEQKPKIKKLSRYEMSTQSSFAKSMSLTKHEQLPSRQKLISLRNLKPRRLKTNPEENQPQRKSSGKIQKCLSCKKIKDLVDQEKNKDTMRMIQQKLSGKSQRKWQQKYLKKRVQSYSKISQTINQVSQLLQLESLKIKNVLNNDQIEDITKIMQKQQQQRENDQDRSQSQDSTPYQYQESLERKSQSQFKLLNHQKQLLNRKFNYIRNKKRKKFSKNQSHSFHKTHSGFLNNNTQSLEKKKTSSLNITQHFNSGLASIWTKQTNELKLQRETIYNNFTKHEACRINTLHQFENTILEGKRNNQNGEESLIHELRQRRAAEKLTKEPKQWHFYNLTGLNKIQLYQTKLNVSAESWLLMDCLEMKYLRGWRVKKSSDKTLLALRLGLFKCFENISKNQSIDLKKIQIRINYHSIENKIIFITNNKMAIKNSKLIEEGYTLRNHTIISIEGLLIGLCRIQGCWDIIFWLIQFCGYLQQKINETNGVPVETLYDEVIYFKEGTDLGLYESTFFNSFMKIVEELQLQSTKISIGYIHCPKIQSNLIDLGILFLSCMKYRPFQSICFNQISYDVPIKYQVGWNHWQSRIHCFKNSFHKVNKFATFGWLQQHFYQTSKSYVQNAKEQDLLVYQPHQKTLTIVNGAKVNLGVSDVMIIDDWTVKTFKRFYKESKGSFKWCEGVKIQTQQIGVKYRNK